MSEISKLDQNLIIRKIDNETINLQINDNEMLMSIVGQFDQNLKELSKFLEKKNKKNHVIATNEGSAVSLGIGHYLSTKKMPCIYMQNSGLSNALNPLISIAHQKVYSIPLLLIIGWRGSPKLIDEPQHNLKGKITRKLLNLLNIDYVIVRSNSDLNKLNTKIKLKN